MTDRVEDLSRAFERFPGIGPRQAKRFVYHLLASTLGDRARLSDLIAHLGADVCSSALNACVSGVEAVSFVTTVPIFLARMKF
jgi:recombinational DNA repair protein RecR